MPRRVGGAKPVPPRPKHARAKAETALKQKRAMELLLGGATYTQIAEQLGLAHRGNAHHLVKNALLATIQPVADEVRATELARLDRLLLSIWQQAITPGPYQLATHDRVYKNMAQRCMYIVGLKVPERVAEVRPDGTSVYSPEIASQEFQTMMDALRARYQGDEALPEAQGEE